MKTSFALVAIALCILGLSYNVSARKAQRLSELSLREYPYCNDVFDPSIPCTERYPNGTYMDGNRPNPYEPCSNIFFKCSNGRSYCYNCQILPSGERLYYNHPILECDYRDNVRDCSGVPISTTTTTPATTTTTMMTTTTTTPTPTTTTTTPTTTTTTTPTTTTTTRTTTAAGYKCPFGDGFWPINEGVCDADYYSCIQGTSYILTCPSGSLFDPFIRICVNETTAICNYKCPAQDGFYPVPGYENYCINNFIHCILTIAYPGTCPEVEPGINAVFDPSLRYCVLQEQCDGQGILTTVSSGNFVCPPGPGQYPVPGSCSLYYACSNGIYIVAQCPPGEAFNPNLSYCTAPSEVPGCNKIDLITYYRDSKLVGQVGPAFH